MHSQLDDFLGPAQGSPLSLQPRDIPTVVSMLGKVSLFELLEAEELGKMAKSMDVREFQEGDVVAWRGNAATDLLIVKSGRCVGIKVRDCNVF